MSNLTQGCHVIYDEAVFSGYWKNASFEGYRTVSGTITKDSYGPKTGQHTFTILVDSIEEDFGGPEANKYRVGQKIRRKGRNVYPLLKKVTYPENHAALAADKSRRRIDNQIWSEYRGKSRTWNECRRGLADD